MSETVAARPGQRPRPRHRGLFWLATLISVMALVGGGYLAISGYLTTRPPGKVALAYFTAVARGDAAGALSYGPVPAGDRQYLTADVLAAQRAIGRIEQLSVLSVSMSGDTAKVDISYSLRKPDGQGRASTDVVPMTRKDRRWWLTQSAVSTKVGITQATNRAAFAGTAFPAGAVLMFPGALPITFDTPNLEIGSSDATVQFAGSDNSRLVVEPSPAGIESSRTAVNSALRRCLDGTSTDPFCPRPAVALPQVAVPQSLRGTLAANAMDALAVTVSPSADGRLEVGGTVHVNGQYQALSYANVPSAVSNPDISLVITATCYLVPVVPAVTPAPLVVSWKTS